MEAELSSPGRPEVPETLAGEAFPDKSLNRMLTSTSAGRCILSQRILESTDPAGGAIGGARWQEGVRQP